MNIFADRLKKIRKKNKISQDKLSDMLDISQNQVSKYEKGTDTPSGTILWKMTQVLKVSTEYLLGIINHVDLEAQYQYMADKRSRLFKSPEGELGYEYYFEGKKRTSIFSYIFTVFSLPEEKMPGWPDQNSAPVLPAEFQLILYLEEIQGDFLSKMMDTDNDLAFSALDGFLNASLALGSCYLDDEGASKIELIIKPQEEEMPRGALVRPSKYKILSACRGYKPQKYDIDIIKEAFLDFYIPLTVEEKVRFLEHV